VGAFFGLGVAYDLVDDAGVKSDIADLTTRLIGFIAQHQWSPNDDASNTFVLRPENCRCWCRWRVMSILQFDQRPSLLPVNTGAKFDVVSNSSYFKFNLDYMSFYNLVRLQNNSDNQAAYQIVRAYTASHQNAFFDMWMRRLKERTHPRCRNALPSRSMAAKAKRETYVDLSHTVPVCGSEACQPIPFRCGRLWNSCGKSTPSNSRAEATEPSKAPASTTFCRIGWGATTERLRAAPCNRPPRRVAPSLPIRWLRFTARIWRPV